MNARAEWRTFMRIAAAVVACLLFAAGFDAYAAGSVDVLEQRVTEDTAYLFLRYGGEAKSAQARIGTEAAGSVEIGGGEPVSVVTWLLMDNSVSISAADRKKGKELLTDLVAGKAAGERFNLCTYSKNLNILAQDSQSYADLKEKIDAIESSNQESYLTDVLAELLDAEKEREDLAYVRVVVVCDGVDNNPEGLTREELNKYLDAGNVPIYTFGCKSKGNEPLLKELYSLSRQTGGKSWTLTDLDGTLEAAKTICEDEIPVCAAVNIPEKLRDGSEKGIQLTFEEGLTAQTQAVMPFGEVSADPEPEPEPTPEPEPEPEPQPEPEKKSVLPLIVTGVAAVIAAVGAAAVLLLRRKKKQSRIEPVREPAGVFSGEKTDILDRRPAGAGGTVVLVDRDSHLMLCLTDCANPDRHFEAPLRGRVSIGRSSENQIVVDYDKSISGRHCEIFVEGKSFYLRDLNSSNGTLVDGLRVVDAAEICNGSTIKLGRVEFTVKIR